jgi:hypothetical protein
VQECRRLVESELINTKEEVVKLVDKVNDLTEEDRYCIQDFEPAVDKNLAAELAKLWAESDAKVAKDIAKRAVAAGVYAIQLIAATAKYDEKCKEVLLLQAKLHDIIYIGDGVCAEDDSPSSSIACDDDDELESHGINFEGTSHTSSRACARVSACNSRRLDRDIKKSKDVSPRYPFHLI